MKILFLVLCLSTAMNSVVAWVLYRTNRLDGPLWWAVGTSVVCAGLSVVFIREIIGEAFSTFVSNVVILAGYAIVWDGMRRFVGRGFSRTVVIVSLLILGICGCGNYWYSMVDYSFGMRIVITSLGMLFFSLAISTTLLSAKLGSNAVLFLGAVYSANVFICGIRVIAPVFSPSLNSLVQSATVSIAYLVFTILFSICVTLGQIYMVEEEDHSVQ